MGKLSYGVREIEARARLSFWIAHGITPDVQEELERYYDGYEISGVVSEEMSGVQIHTTYIEFPQY